MEKKICVILIFLTIKIYSMQEFTIQMKTSEFESQINQLTNNEKKIVVTQLINKYKEHVELNKNLRKKLKAAKDWLKLRDEIEEDKKEKNNSSNDFGFNEGQDFMDQLNSFDKDVKFYEEKISKLPKVNKQLIIISKNLLAQLDKK